MQLFLRKNPELTPKMPEYSPAILTKSYVDFYKPGYCSEFLEAGKPCLVLECGLSDYNFDDNFRKKDPKNNIEWCEIEVIDKDLPPDCSEFYVHAADLEPIEDPDFHFYS